MDSIPKITWNWLKCFHMEKYGKSEGQSNVSQDSKTLLPKCIEIINSYSGVEREKNVPQNSRENPINTLPAPSSLEMSYHSRQLDISLIFFDKSCYVMITVWKNLCLWGLGKTGLPSQVAGYYRSSRKGQQTSNGATGVCQGRCKGTLSGLGGIWPHMYYHFWREHINENWWKYHDQHLLFIY